MPKALTYPTHIQQIRTFPLVPSSSVKGKSCGLEGRMKFLNNKKTPQNNIGLILLQVFCMHIRPLDRMM